MQYGNAPSDEVLVLQERKTKTKIKTVLRLAIPRHRSLNVQEEAK